ncbi:Hypothetical Protein FCC1311_050972 [Hondaea fermentalgiana]|uniref:Paraquat-inducible protein A n=1 Tax=Hondaea fermentalgiana TaxID=2315210 RepID=A0A2R5GD24_9STRA|nr:Hypothetical Protein FCC1311_050972 [Hondaea fermentalgiana]|eukprot:GBG28876.1 Hypothetical Protein FCC1311_050972 [Hondaea fermentalgiana]
MGKVQDETAVAKAVAVGDSEQQAVAASGEKGKTSSLHAQYSEWIGYVSLCFLLGNVGLQVFSHLGMSMAILSNVNVNGESTKLLSGVEFCSSNDTIFSDWWVAAGSSSVYEDIIDCADDYILADEGKEFSDLETCLRAEAIGYQGGEECILCYQDYVNCASASSEEGGCLNSCFAAAVFGGADEYAKCVACTVEKCNPNFEVCIGYSMPDPPDEFDVRRALRDGRTLRSTEGARKLASDPPEQLYVVYEISFIKSIKDAWDSGAYGVAILLTLLSGVWPYAKNLIMLVAWFVPMTTARRSTVLKVLTRLAKWSLLDVFVVVIMLAGFRIDLQGDVIGRIYVVAESRLAIYTFCLAAIWDLVQGEWMRTMHLAMAESEPDCDPVSSVEGSCLLTSATFGASATTCGSCARVTHFLLSLVQLALLICGCFLPCATFALYGNAFGLFFNNEPGEYAEYSAFEIGTAIVAPERIDSVHSVGGTFFLAIIFLLCSIFVPAIVFSGMAKALHLQPCGPFAPRASLLKALASFCDIVGGFAALDVFLLSVVVTMLEWDRFVNSAMSTLTDKFIGCEEPCLESRSDVQYAVYLMLGAVLIGWILELFFTYVFAQIYHPAEQTFWGPFLFNRLASCIAK